MRGIAHAVRLGLTVLAALLMSLDGALAQETTTVNSGSTIELVSKAKRIDDQKPDNVLTKESHADGTFTLKFRAPTVATDTTYSVTYTGDTGQVTRTVMVKAAQPQSQSTLLTGDALQVSTKVLLALLVLAIILENALALLFNWRPFVDTFDRRAVQPLVAFVVAYIFIAAYKFDAVSALMKAYGYGSVEGEWLGLIITAMVVAGGSSAVNRLMQTLGIRVSTTAQNQSQPPPPQPEVNQAWLAVIFHRRTAIGPANVMLRTIPPNHPAGTPMPAGEVIGAVDGHGVVRGRLLSYFFRSRSRFPPSGGYAVAAGNAYELWLEAKVGNDIRPSAHWGPYPVAGKAIIDLELEL